MEAPYLPSRLVSAGLLLTALFAAFAARAEDPERVVESTHYGSGGRETRTQIEVSGDRQPSTGAKIASASASKSGSQTAGAVNQDFWFYSTDVILYGDQDLDGFYSGIDLLFDVDTIYSVADVYAVIFLSLEGGDWEEFAATENFTIYGATSTDDYSIVTDLVSGFPTGEYDLLIELYDAFNDDYLAYIGPSDTSELSFLPLEDVDRDTPLGGGTTVIVNSEGGGSASYLFLGLLALVFAQRHRVGRRELRAQDAGVLASAFDRARRPTFLLQAARLSK